MNPQEVLSFCREKDVKAVDIRFTDLLGTWQHFTIPVSKLDLEMFENGLGFDGSILRGWRPTHQSDMRVVPHSSTAVLDPFTELPTLILIGSIQDPITTEESPSDPRNIARKAVDYLRHTDIADTAYFGPEAEFFIFDDILFDQGDREGFFQINTRERRSHRGMWDSSERVHRQVCFPVPPVEKLKNIRNEMMDCMIHCGLQVECQHHEFGAAGQSEIDLKHQGLVPMADAMMLYKYIVKSVASRHGKSATFMPKPIFGENGSGMHTHFSLSRDGQPIFAGNGYAGLSELALHAIGGLLHHAPAVMAFTNPTTNSYKRLVPGHEAPIHLAYSQSAPSVACRIPMLSANPKTKRIEFRCPDATCNPYLAFSAMLMAAIDGIQNKLHPGEPFGGDVSEADLERSRRIPTGLTVAIDALEHDHDFLLRGDVFTPDVIASWIAWKRECEIEPLQMRPHPFEFCLYYDI